MERELVQLIVDGGQIGIREGFRFSLYVIGISLVWRVARIPDLSSYAAIVLAGALAGVTHAAKLYTSTGYVLAGASGAVIGLATFLLWRRCNLNILVVGVLLSSMGFSVAAILMGFKATLQTTELLSTLPGSPWAAATRHASALAAALVVLAIFFQSSWGGNLFTWARSEPLASFSGDKQCGSYDLLALVAGGVCVAVSGFMQARDHGEFSLNEGRGLLFMALVMIVLGETAVVVIRLCLRRVTQRVSPWARKHCGFLLPFLILVAAPIGAVLYWVLVNMTDVLLVALSKKTGIGQYWSGLSQGVVALLAILCLLALRSFAKREDIYEPWRFRA